MPIWELVKVLIGRPRAEQGAELKHLSWCGSAEVEEWIAPEGGWVIESAGSRVGRELQRQREEAEPQRTAWVILSQEQLGSEGAATAEQGEQRPEGAARAEKGLSKGRGRSWFADGHSPC